MTDAFHYLDATLATAPENVALDEALLVEAEERGGPPVLRVWELDHLAVVLGASCRIGQNVKLDACRADGVGLRHDGQFEADEVHLSLWIGQMALHDDVEHDIPQRRRQSRNFGPRAGQVRRNSLSCSGWSRGCRRSRHIAVS